MAWNESDAEMNRLADPAADTPADDIDDILADEGDGHAPENPGEAGVDAMTRAILATAHAYADAVKNIERGIARAGDPIERAHKAEAALVTITTWLKESEARDAEFTSAMSEQRTEIKARIAAAQAAGDLPQAKAMIKPYRRMIEAIDKVLRVSSKPTRLLREARTRIAAMEG